MSSPNSDHNFLGENLVLFYVFCGVFVVEHVSKKIKTWIGEWLGGVWQSEFFSDFFIFLT